MPDNWIEIKTRGPRGKGDEATDFLIKAGSPGVLEDEIQLPKDTLKSQSFWDSRDEICEGAPSPKVSFTAYLPAGSPDRALQVRAELKRIGFSFSASAFKDRDWSVKWKSSIKPVRVKGDPYSILIKPTWSKIPKRKGELVIEIDPGMAFGTGGHATTKMCLKAMLQLLKKDKSLSAFLDVGTGTGVLAIAAKKLRMKKVVGIDIDKVALKVARKNARFNGSAITVSGSPVEKVKGSYSIVAANILAGELIKLAPAISAKVAPGGFLILSGILKMEEDRVVEGYATPAFKLIKKYSSNEWAALVFKRCR